MDVFEYLDNCPQCGERDCHPHDKTVRAGEVVASYECGSCGHCWSTSYQPQNGESEATFREAS